MRLKAVAVAVMALGSSLAVAGSMGPVCTPGNVTVPCEANSWGFGIQALYLEVLSNNNSWLSNYNLGSSSGERLYGYEKGLEWGFRLDASYYFSTGNDLTLNWTYWKDPNDRRATITGRWAADQTGVLETAIDANTRFDQVNFELGQHVDFGEHKDIRFHGGVQYARIENNNANFNSLTGSVLFPDENFAQNVTTKQKFDGVGPRVGADMTYNFDNGFALYGNGATAILVGTSISRDDAPTTPTSRPVNSRYDAIVPEIEAKLGGKYTWGGFAQGMLTLDVGYMVVDYIDALHYSNVDLVVSGLEIRDNIHFGLSGPYAGIKWVG